MNDFKLLVIIFAYGILSTVLIKVIIKVTIKIKYRRYIFVGAALIVLSVIISTSSKSGSGEPGQTQYIEKINELEKEIQYLEQQNSIIEAIRYLATYIMGVLSPVLTEWWGESIKEARDKRKRNKLESGSENKEERKKKHKKRKKKKG